MKYSILVFMLLLLLTSCSSVTSGMVESTTVVSANISTEEKVKTIDVENMNGETFTFYIRWKIDGWD